MSIEITDTMVQAFRAATDGYIKPSVQPGLAAVLNLPEVRDAFYADVRREIEAKLKAAGVTGYSVEGF